MKNMKNTGNTKNTKSAKAAKASVRIDPKSRANIKNAKTPVTTAKATSATKAATAATAAITINPPLKPLKTYQHILIVSAILMIAILLYSNSIKNGFIYFDDPECVTENYSIRQINWDNIVHYFTTPLQYMYTPVVLISYATDYQIGKLDPTIYHATNLLFHLINIILVYCLFLILTRQFHLSIFIAVLFAIHPVNVDGISWIGVRNNILSTLFYLGSLLFYTYYLKNNLKLKYLILSVFSFLLAAFSKSSAIVLPVILFLWDYYYGRKWKVNLLIEKIPFFLISLFIGIITLQMRTDVSANMDYTLFDRFIMICSSLTAYLYKLIIPFPLSFVYAYPAKNGEFLPPYLYLAPIIFCLIVWGLYKLKISKKVIMVGLGFFLINILLSQAVVLIDNYKANRYAYLGYIGLYFILAELNGQILFSVKGWRSKIKSIWKPLLVIFVIVFSFLTYSRNSLWKDTVTLLDDVIKKQPDIPWVYNNRGIAKYKDGDYEGALKDFNHTLELDSNFLLSYYYKGVLKEIDRDFQGSVAEYDTAISLDPQFSEAYFGRGKSKLELKDYQGALHDFSKSVEIDAYFVDGYLYRGMVKSKIGNYEGAIADYDMAISYDPEYGDLYNYRGAAKMELKDYQGAINDLNKAIELNQGYAEAYYNRGNVKNQLNDESGARSDWNKALELGYQPVQNAKAK
jgi:tetratricopeptide (TPR) repeat protein